MTALKNVESDWAPMALYLKLTEKLKAQALWR